MQFSVGFMNDIPRTYAGYVYALSLHNTKCDSVSHRHTLGGIKVDSSSQTKSFICFVSYCGPYVLLARPRRVITCIDALRI